MIYIKMANVKELNKIIKRCYTIYTKNYMNKFIDTDWSHVYEMASKFNYIPGVEDVEIKPRGYVNFPIEDINKSSYKEYLIIIETRFGIIEGSIECHLSGSMDNPLSSYDMVISLNPENKEDNNIKNINESLNFKSAWNDLKMVETFDELKSWIRKYTREGMLAGALITMAMSSFTFSDSELQNLKQDAYQWETTRLIDIDDTNDIEEIEEIEDNDPKWELIANNVETTVYNAVPAQCNNDVLHTASGFELNLSNPEAHHVIAMERTMMKKYGLKYGDLVKILGTDGRDGIYQILDTMNKRFRGRNKIDILINNNSKIGKWKNAQVYKLLNPEQSYNELKLGMAPARNQSSMDKRYKAKISKLNEILNANLLNFNDDDDDISFSKSKVKSAHQVNIEGFIDTIKDIMKHTLVNVDTNDEDAMDLIDVQVNPADTQVDEMSEVRNLYNILDVADDGRPLLMVSPKPLKGKRELNRYNKELSLAIGNKRYKAYYRILLDKNNGFLHICIHNSYLTCKYFTISKPIIDFITECPIPIKSIGVFSGSYINLNEDGDPVLNSISEDVTFYFTKGWKGRHYYLPNHFKGGQEMPKEFMVSQDFVDHFPTKISSRFERSEPKKITIYNAIFPNIAGYLKIVNAFVNANYTIEDEYGNTYDETNIGDAQNILTDNTDPDKIEKKKNKIKLFLEGQLGLSTLSMFDDIIASKLFKHLYVKLLYKFNRRQKNIYKKLAKPVLNEFLKDNGIDLEDILKKSIDQCELEYEPIEKRYNDIQEMIINRNLPARSPTNIINWRGEDILSMLSNIPSKKILSDDIYRFAHSHNIIGSTDFFRRGLNMTDTQYHDFCIDVLLNRFIYKMRLKIIYDNPNGWNNREGQVNPIDIFTYIEEESYMGGLNRRPWDFCDIPLAIDDQEELLYFFYVCAYALNNAYCQSSFGPSDLSMDELTKASIEPNLNTIKFDAITKCLKTIFGDMTSKN